MILIPLQPRACGVRDDRREIRLFCLLPGSFCRQAASFQEICANFCANAYRIVRACTAKAGGKAIAVNCLPLPYVPWQDRLKIWRRSLLVWVRPHFGLQ